MRFIIGFILGVVFTTFGAEKTAKAIDMGITKIQEASKPIIDKVDQQ